MKGNSRLSWDVGVLRKTHLVAVQAACNRAVYVDCSSVSPPMMIEPRFLPAARSLKIRTEREMRIDGVRASVGPRTYGDRHEPNSSNPALMVVAVGQPLLHEAVFGPPTRCAHSAVDCYRE